MRFLTVMVALLLAAPAAAQTLTITKPDAPPVVIECGQGCTIAVAAPAPPPPPPPPPCTFTVSPTSLSAPAAGAAPTVSVTPSRDGCEWSSESFAPWVTVDTLAGPLIQVLAFAPNTATSSRSGAVVVAGQTVMVSQEGAPAPPPPPPPPTVEVLARMDCTAANFPACGWSAWDRDRNTRWTSRLLANQAPGGRDAVEFTIRPTGPTQFYLGWGVTAPGAVEADAVRYYRFRIFAPGPTGQTRGYVQGFESKFIIHADGAPNGSRVICGLRDNGLTSDTIAFECMRNVDGPEHGTVKQALTLGVWHSIQVEARSGSRGVIRVWVDTNDYSRPTSSTERSGTSAFSLGTTNWNSFGLGFYQGVTRTIAQDTVIFRLADDAEFGRTFDPNWHR